MDSKTIPRTFNALEAKLDTKKETKKDKMELLQKQQLHDSRKEKKLKERMGCLPTSAFLYSLLARPSIVNDAHIRISVETQGRAS